jgi:hypothetical protein
VTSENTRQHGGRWAKLGLRIGLCIFAAGVVAAGGLGITINAFPQDALIEFFRRCGLVLMLIGMVVVLCCLPVVQRCWRSVGLFVERWSEPARMGDPPAACADPYISRPISDSQQSFPLAALFLGLSAAAVLCGLVAPMYRPEDDFEALPEKLFSIIGAALAISFWSWIISWIATWSLRSSLIGMVAGMIWGACIAAVLLVPREQIGTSAMAAILGSGAMLVVAIVGRKKRQQPAAMERAATKDQR